MALAGNAGKKVGYHHNDLRNALQDTALALIAQRHGPAFSLRELAAALGVSHPAVYRHFPDKAALLEALAERGFSELRRYQEVELAGCGPGAVEQLHALGDAYIRFAEENPGAFWLMFGNRGEEVSRAKSRERINAAALETLIDVIERCQKDGDVIPGDPYRLAGYLVMAPHGYACYSSQDRAMIGITEHMLNRRMLSGISLIPVLTHPPSPQEIAQRYFAAPAVHSGASE
ncbi:MAG: TetR/AcrR family transcriptional regulator [Rhizobiaceae bacterium]|nr:TetR/AcrR family transcriptional regulator [Rhizobiaceae bacterium]MCV0406918.1 TetR/AcrR family transcriptional regulator [Rhizobiaceae bacterium]